MQVESLILPVPKLYIMTEWKTCGRPVAVWRLLEETGTYSKNNILSSQNTREGERVLGVRGHVMLAYVCNMFTQCYWNTK